MTNKRLYLLLLAAVILLLAGLLGGTYEANNLLAAESHKLVNLKAESQAASLEQVSLVKAKKEIEAYSSLEKIANSVVPQDKDQAEAVREIVNIAALNGVKLGSISFPSSTLGNAPASTNGSSSSSSSTATKPAASSNDKTAKLSQLQPVKSISGVYLLPITIQGDSTKPVEYNQFISFLKDLEHNRRTAQVSSITIAPSALNHNNLTFTLILNEYIRP